MVSSLGAIGAIFAAWLGIHLQLRQVAEKVARDEIEGQRQAMVALLAELEVYSTALADIDRKMSNDLGVLLSGMLQMIFPSASFRFAVYRANADKVWAIPDDRIRRTVIAIYAELDLFFLFLIAIARSQREFAMTPCRAAKYRRNFSACTL